jgi:hypothetical protein
MRSAPVAHDVLLILMQLGIYRINGFNAAPAGASAVPRSGISRSCCIAASVRILKSLGELDRADPGLAGLRFAALHQPEGTLQGALFIT